MAVWNQDKQAIGNRIRNAREKRGWSSTELSIQSDINAVQISRYENGFQLPSLENVSKIAAALELPLSAFQSPELDQYGGCSLEESAILDALHALSPAKRRAACEHILSIIQLMK